MHVIVPILQSEGVRGGCFKFRSNVVTFPAARQEEDGTHRRVSIKARHSCARPNSRAISKHTLPLCGVAFASLCTQPRTAQHPS